MTIKQYISVFFFLCLGIFGHSQDQTTFSHRVNFGYPNSVYTSVLEVEDGYVLTGFLGAVENPWSTPMIFSKYDLEGNHLFNKVYGGYQDKQFWVVEDNLIRINDNELVCTGFGFSQETNYRQGLIMKLNLEGDTIQTHQFYSPYFNIDDEDPEAFISIVDIVQDQEGCLYLSANIFNSETENDGMIIKFDNELNLMWTIFTQMPNTDSFPALFIQNSNLYAYIYGSWDEMIHVYDLNGQLTEVISFDEPIRCYDFIINNENDSFMIAHVNGYFNDNGDHRQDRGVNSYDFDGNLNWQMLPIQNEESWSYQEFTDIEPTIDLNYTIAGHDVVYLEEFDSLDGDYNVMGHLVKFTGEGELLWERKFKHVQSIYDVHLINDLKSTTDGGYIMCGEARDNYHGEGWENEIGQQAWVVKLDECGCLIPGCDPNCDYRNWIEEGEADFLLGPNPVVQGSLNVHYFGQDYDNTSTEFLIYSIDGKLIDSFQAYSSNTTYIYSTSALESGIYLVSLIREGEVVGSERVLVEN